jgi:phosphosulfolactate synthase (CoM biosynthesis protein A)
MKDDPHLQKTAFPFVRVAPRPYKPRKTGLTAFADRGLGMNQVADILETSGDYIDLAKLAVGMYRLQTEAFLKRKIGAYRKAGIRVFTAGDVSEAAFMQGVSLKFFKELKRLGVDGVEISSAQVTISLKDKCELIRMAKGEGLLPIPEAGEKDHEDWTRSVAHVVRQIEEFKRAGAWQVLFQDEGVSRDFKALKSEFILNVVSRFEVGDFLFQLKNANSQAWFIGTFGNGVNLDVDHHQVLEVELMRRGIRKRGLFGLLGSLPPADR